MDANPLRLILMYFIVPLWMAAGFADWLCHRRTHIERNAGYPESLMHLLMMAELAVPALLVLFLQVNALIFAVCIAAFIAHDATALWDVSYAVRRRKVSPVEQHVHSFLELVPLMGLVCLAALHWDQFLALFGAGHAPADFSLHWKTPPLPRPYVVAVIAAMGLFEALPFVEELVRDLSFRRSHQP